MNNVGFTLSALWAIRDIPRGVLGGNAKGVLIALISFADENDRIEVNVTQLLNAADMGKTTFTSELDRLKIMGLLQVTSHEKTHDRSVYKINLAVLRSMIGRIPPEIRSQKPRGVSLIPKLNVPIGSVRNNEKVKASVRSTVMLRDKGMCRYCGIAKANGLDHIVPRSFGGPSTIENLVLSCAKCNSKKNARTPEQAGMILLEVPS